MVGCRFDMLCAEDVCCLEFNTLPKVGLTKKVHASNELQLHLNSIFLSPYRPLMLMHTFNTVTYFQ